MYPETSPTSELVEFDELLLDQSNIKTALFFEGHEAHKLKAQLTSYFQKEPNFKGQYTHKKRAQLPPFKDMPLNKLVRYFMRQGRHQTAYKHCLKAFSALYTIILKDASLQTFDRLGGYSPVAGEFLQSNRFYNPNTLVS